MTVTLDKTHELKGSGFLLGVSGENESEELVINIAYDVLLDKWAYIEFEQNGKPYTTERLSIANNQIVYVVPNGLLVQGDVFVQAVFRDASGFVWKSFKKKCLVTDEINASNNYPQTYPDFITEAQSLLDEVSVESEKVDAVLLTEEARASAEAERVENEATRQANEAERVATESERKTAETARASAENERQTAETARADAENARRTEFSGWSSNIGNLNTYDKRLINLEEAGVGILFDYVTDDATAYSKTVPASALPYARLVKVGDAVTSVKSIGKNLIDFESVASELVDRGQTIETFDGKRCLKIVRNGVYSVNIPDGAHGLMCNFYVIGDFGKSWATINFSNGSQLYINANTANNVWYTHKLYFADKTITQIQFYSENTETSPIYVDIDGFMIEKSTTATEYEAYNGTNYAMPLTDNYIKVEPNGTIVFENDDAQAVPSEIVYAVKR